MPESKHALLPGSTLRMSRGLRQVAALLTLAAALVLAQAASAQVQYLDGGLTPISGALDFKFGPYTPDIDSDPSLGGATPYSTVFGGGGLLSEVVYEHHLWQGIGTASIGFHLGFFSKKADALNADGTRSADATRLSLVPLRLSGVYRFDYLEERFNIPLVLSARVGLDYYFYRVKGGDGTADFSDADGSSTGRGGTHGWHAGATLYFLLDILAPNMARDLDSATGINNSYLFAEFLHADIRDFGADDSWDVGDTTFLFGLGFEL